MRAAPLTMIRALCLLGIVFGAAFPQSVLAKQQERLLFFGDVMLSREVGREIDRRGGASPWSDMESLGQKLGAADFAMINFEGALADLDQKGQGCEGAKGPCFAVLPSRLPFLREAGVTAASIVNNHAGDLGEAGRAATEKALQAAGIDSLDFQNSPGFVRLGRWSVAIVAISLIPARDGVVERIPSFDVERKMRLARTLADWVVVSIHWGAELRNWPDKTQTETAGWLIDHGADLIIGHHPHVVAPPQCVKGRPVFYSLGNDVFDQKYPESKKGLIADCRLNDEKGGMLSCSALETNTPMGSSFPRLAGPSVTAQTALDGCGVPAKNGLSINGRRLFAWTEQGRLKSDALVIEGRAPDQKPWRVAGRKILSAETGLLEPEKRPYLFTLERHFSPIDKENSPRPYVYEVEDRGLVARWRGTALAWPLIDARLMKENDSSNVMLLCALHRADSFLLMDPANTETRIAVYRWNGFGFSGVDDKEAAARCQSMYGEK